MLSTASRLLAQADSYDQLHAYLHEHPEGLRPYLDKNFKFFVEGINHRIPSSRQR